LFFTFFFSSKYEENYHYLYIFTEYGSTCFGQWTGKDTTHGLDDMGKIQV
jgi:hypothetical protein